MTRDLTSTHIDEVADGIFRLSSYLAPFDLTVNQFLVLADEPLLFHLGFRSTFADVHAAVGRVIEPARLRWLSFGHVEADECGALNHWLAAAAHARPVFNPLGCMVSIDDLADRSPHQLDDGDVLDLGGRRVRLLRTPHAPHNWEAQVLFEETTATLFCGDLCSTLGSGPAVVHDAETLAVAALAAETVMPSSPTGPTVPATLRRLAGLHPRALAVMHGSSFTGDGEAVLGSLADRWEHTFAVDQTHQWRIGSG